MSGARAVVATARNYRAAVAELRGSARHSDLVPGAVVVIPGGGPWWTLLLEAQAAGAAAVVVSNPGRVPPEAGSALSADAVTLPVVVERPYARADILADALDARAANAPTMVTVECAARAPDLGATLRDGLRWAAVLAGGPLSYCGGGDGTFLLEAAGVSGPVPVTAGVRLLTGDARDPLLRVMALGEVRSEIESGRVGAGVRLETATFNGTIQAPLRYETPARLALRRALDSCRSGERPDDLEHLLSDHDLAAHLLEPHK